MDRNGINKHFRLLLAIIFAFGYIVLNPSCNCSCVYSYTGYQDKTYFYQNFNYVLSKYVSNNGKVNYTALQEDQKHLDLFMYAIKVFSRQNYFELPEHSKVAFWLNAYNAIVLKTILEYYPVKSIKDIPGVFKKKRYIVMEEKISLEHIEHEILRKQFHDPRIHMALSKGTIGSASLRKEAYLGNILNDQLNNQTRMFLHNPQKFQIDHYNSIIYISPIFKWYAKDFMQIYSTKLKYKAAKPKMRAVMSFIETHSSKNVVSFLYSKLFYIEYLNYNWNLNDLKKPHPD